MRFPVACAFLLLFTSFCTAKSNSDENTHTATLYAWPFPSKAPAPFLKVSYNPESHTYSTSDYQPPAAPPHASDDDTQELIRIGLYDAKTKQWTGVLTHTSAFRPGQASTVTLHLDDKGDVQHAGFRSTGVKQQDPEAKGAEAIQVRLVTAQAGPEPHVNKPVMVDAEGKEPVVEVQKSLLQRQATRFMNAPHQEMLTFDLGRYWWVLAGLVILALAGPGDK